MIETDFSERFPLMSLGILEAEVSCEVTQSGFLRIFHDEIIRISGKYNLGSIKDNPAVSATRAAYKRNGADPARYRPSAESLLRRIIKNRGLFSVNNVVDVLNLISIRSGYSISGFDKRKISGDIVLGTGKSDEPYTGIGRGTVNIHRLPVLRDNTGAFGCPTSDSERASIDNTTKEILFVFYNFDHGCDCMPYLVETGKMLEKYCSAKEVKLRVLNATAS